MNDKQKLDRRGQAKLYKEDLEVIINENLIQTSYILTEDVYNSLVEAFKCLYPARKPSRGNIMRILGIRSKESEIKEWGFTINDKNLLSIINLLGVDYMWVNVIPEI